MCSAHTVRIHGNGGREVGRRLKGSTEGQALTRIRGDIVVNSVINIVEDVGWLALPNGFDTWRYPHG